MNRHQARASSGFTITELIVATTISGIVLASMVGTFLTFAVGARSVGAYTDMSKDSRIVLENFARDMRAAEDVLQASSSTLEVVFPDTSFYGGSRVTYDYDKDAKVFFRIEVDSSGSEVSNELLLEGVEQFTFSYYDPLGDKLSASTESILLSVKSVQIDAEMQRNISRSEATDYIISARFMMRNRPVTE
ncbi:type II secretion system protein [Coraliomargarita sinensis]|nr:type II secretion system protein [Coraliomargarita sinensis]